MMNKDEGMFDQFIEDEIMDIEIFNLIYDFVALDNFRQGEYEGNMFVIRKINANHIQLEDEVATENTSIPAVYTYTKKKFLSLLQSHKPRLLSLLNWKKDYIDPNILDGTQWEIVIIQEKLNLIKSGSNQFPTQWKDFCSVMSKLSGREFH